MTMLWRGLFILPLLFVLGNSQFLFPFRHPFEQPPQLPGLTVGGRPGHIGGFILDGQILPVDNGDFYGHDNEQGSKAEKEMKAVDDGAADVQVVQEGGDTGKDFGGDEFKGKWELFVENSGVSAMHVILLPKIDQVMMFDATIWKISKLKLPGPPCRPVEGTNELDCFCHSVLLDIETKKIKPLRVH